jgi:hypothetical protein
VRKWARGWDASCDFKKKNQNQNQTKKKKKKKPKKNQKKTQPPWQVVTTHISQPKRCSTKKPGPRLAYGFTASPLETTTSLERNLKFAVIFIFRGLTRKILRRLNFYGCKTVKFGALLPRSLFFFHEYFVIKYIYIYIYKYK